MGILVLEIMVRYIKFIYYIRPIMLKRRSVDAHKAQAAAPPCATFKPSRAPDEHLSFEDLEVAATSI